MGSRLKLIIICKKILRILLMFLFRFEWWHTSPSDNRPYACDIVSELRKRKADGSVLELGCGLGDILGKIKCREKYFFDVSDNVLRAAKFLQYFSFKNTLNHYKEFNFIEDTLDKKMSVDVVILVNWIHAYKTSILREKFSDLTKFNLNPGGIVVFDLIENNSNYKYNHRIQELLDTELFDIETFSGYKFGRKIVYATLK